MFIMDKPAMFNGRVLDDKMRTHFRTFIYNAQDESKLVNSWAEYEMYMDTGEWFPSRKDALNSLKPKEENVREIKEPKFRRR